jgi:hypothetical protein
MLAVEQVGGTQDLLQQLVLLGMVEEDLLDIIQEEQRKVALLILVAVEVALAEALLPLQMVVQELLLCATRKHR